MMSSGRLSDLSTAEKKLLFDIIVDHWHVIASTYMWNNLDVFTIKSKCAADATNEELCEKFIELAGALTLSNIAYVYRIANMSAVASDLNRLADTVEHRVRMRGYYPDVVNADTKDMRIETLTKENEYLKTILRNIVNVIDN